MKVLVVYHYFARYRKGVLERMSEDKDNSYYFFAGDTSEIDIEKLEFPFVDSGSMESKSIGGVNIWILKNKFLWQRGLLKEALSGEFDSYIFLGSPYFLSTWIAAVMARLRGRKVFFWTHGFIRGTSVKDRIRKLFFRISDGLMIYGEGGKSTLVDAGFSEDAICVVNNSLDFRTHQIINNSITPQDILKLRCDLFYENLPILVFIGRLTPQKKLHQIIRLQKSLEDDFGILVNVLFIGDGPERTSIENYVSEMELVSRVVFYGSCHEEKELGPLLAASDICISPGEVGLTAIHSLSYGTPVISHDSMINQMPEYESIVHKETGMLYKYESFQSLVNVTKWWLEQPVNRAEIRSRCIREVTSRYTPEFQVNVMNKFMGGGS